jgi:hypothetical protein
VQAAVLLPVVRLALSRARVTELLRIAERGSGNSKSDYQEIRRTNPPSPIGNPQSTARLVRIAAERGLYRARCLEQSLVLRWLLRKQGIEARILFGARKEDEQIQVHAWVEVNGVAVSDDEGEHRRFSPLEELVASMRN